MDQTNAVFIPEFETGVFVQSVSSGQKTFPTREYFATERTAYFIADKFGDGAIYMQDYLEPFGLYFVSHQMRMIKFTPEYPGSGEPPEPRLVNAGTLAAYYVRNPEAEFPGLAEKMIRAQLKTGV